MSEFIAFPQANDVLKAAPGTENYVRDLPIFRQQPYVVSCIEFGPAELAEVVANSCIFLQIDGEAGTSAQAYAQCLARFALLADFYDAPTAECMMVAFTGANAGELLFMQPLPGQQLPADSHPCAVGCFPFTEAQIKLISSTGRVYVKALGTTHPPICVHHANPISFNVPAEAAAE